MDPKRERVGLYIEGTRSWAAFLKELTAISVVRSALSRIKIYFNIGLYRPTIQDYSVIFIMMYANEERLYLICACSQHH